LNGSVPSLWWFMRLSRALVVETLQIRQTASGVGLKDFTRPRFRRLSTWAFILGVVIGVNFVLIITGISNSTSDFLAALSAEFLALLVILEILPMEREPDMEFVNDTYSHSFHVIHPHGDFTIRLLYVGVRNKPGVFAQFAGSIKVSIALQMPYAEIPSAYPLPWQYYPHDEIRIKKPIDPTSPGSVVDALNEHIFSKRKMDFDPDDNWHAIVAFGLSTTGGIYSATETPIQLNIPIRKSPEAPAEKFILSLPVSLKLSGPSLTIPPISRPFMIRGTTWEDATINPVRIGKESVVEGPPPSGSD